MEERVAVYNALTLVPRLRKLLLRRQLIMLLVALITLFALTWGGPILSALSKAVGQPVYDVYHCLTVNCKPTGPAAPWSEQLAAVKQASSKLDPSTRLILIYAAPANYKVGDWTLNAALNVTLDYKTFTGEFITISYLDTAPATTLTVTHEMFDGSYRSYLSDVPDHTQAEQTLSTFALSPRDALSKTWQLMSSGLMPSTDMYDPTVDLNLLSPIRTAWQVNYYPLSSRRDQRDYTQSSIVYWLDPVTGAYIDRSNILLPLATPTVP